MKLIALLTLIVSTLCARAAESTNDGKTRIIIEGPLTGASAPKVPLLYSTSLEHGIQITREKHTHVVDAKFEILQGDASEVGLILNGLADVKNVTGAALLDWSVRVETNGVRSLILRPRKGETNFNVQITAERELRAWTNPVQALTFGSPHAALFHGYVKIEAASDLDVQATNTVGLVPIENKFLPEKMRRATGPEQTQLLAFRFQGAAYSLPLIVNVGDPEARRVVLRDFDLRGKLSADGAKFTLVATAQVKNPRGGVLNLLGGRVALADLQENPNWRIRFQNEQFYLYFDKAGEFPIRIEFSASVRREDGWNKVDFRVAPAVIAPVTLEGLAADTQIQFANAARPERSGEVFKSFLPPNGEAHLAWKEAPAATEGKLFYSAEMLSQISVSPGLMRQVTLIHGKIMQGELSRVTLVVRGSGNVTAVQGSNILAWNFEANVSSSERRILVQFNQPQKESFSLQAQMQMELGAFPQTIEAMQIRPEGATRLAGHLRVVNDGAVRLEVLQATGLSQISPEQFLETEATKAVFAAAGSQRFAFRFSSADFSLRLQADNILPEISVSQLLAYHLGERELAIDAELELDIREAPVREVSLRAPKGYALARIAAAGMVDYFYREPADSTNAELRVIYGQPIFGRQVIQLRLERNSALAAATWELGRVELVKAKSTRGHVAVSADAGFRLTPERTVGLTDIATAFFPRKVAGIQSAFRITEANWEATLRVERLPQSIQADVLHLFTIGEGVAYGSSTINYFISGAPISTFLVQLSDEYFNVEFNGKDLRSNWQKATNGYLVTLNTPVSGPYTLLVTYERPFKAQGDTLTFTGARPVDAQTEQGHTLVVSAYQFQVQPVNVSAGLLPLETAEVPAEYRLFFDAPILAAYRYTARPFNLQLALRPLAQAETLGLVVDRASLTTRISKDGEVVTDAHYFVKNRGNPHLRLELPAGTTLWSVTVNGATVVPVKDGEANLIPLPQRADPNAVQTLDLKLASRSKEPSRVLAAAPVVAAPVLLAEWNVQPDAGQRLVFRKGSLAPSKETADISGFAVLWRALRDPQTLTYLLAGIGLILFALWVCRWATRVPSRVRRVGGALVTLIACVFAFAIFAQAADRLSFSRAEPPPGLTFLAPVMQSRAALSVEVENVALEKTFARSAFAAWPAVLAILIWGYAFLKGGEFTRPIGLALGWTLLAWAALRVPNGVGAFLGVAGAFLVLHVLLPALKSIVRAPAAAALLLFIASAQGQTTTPPAPLAESVIQQIRAQEKFAVSETTIRWRATKGQLLPILLEPGVLTRISYPSNSLKLVQAPVGTRRAHQLSAQEDGVFEIRMQYQVSVGSRESETGFALPTQPGLVNRVTLTIPEADVDASSTNAVSVERQAGTNGTVVTLVLAPKVDSWISLKPRSRDVTREKPVFFAELAQLYAPAAGAIEGVHQVTIRPAQGELSELTFDVPAGATITDVTPATVWRFDPDTRKLRVTLAAAQSKPFTITIRSQVSTGPLPMERTLGLISVEGAEGQVGSVGVATGNEVQLDSVTIEGAAPINLEDFPAAALEPLKAGIAGVTLRRAFRYGDARSAIILKASAVEPDVRVETQETLSIGEDRTLLAINAAVEVTRAGIFRLSFVLPARLDVESIGGAGLSHWTELRSETGRVITLHLTGKTEGQRQFNITLAGPGVRSMTNFIAPRVVIREASKQRGQLAIVPEQGMRLQVGAREGVTQLDPQKAGIRQKGVLVFRLLQADWSLALDLEQVDAWVQVVGLQHVTVTEAQLKMAANFQYQIENTGLKSLRVALPANAEGVRFRGDQVSDFMVATNQTVAGMQTWEVKLHRRVIGKYFLQANWQTPIAQAATNALVQGIQALDANLQRGFVTVQSSGRLQIRIATLPAALQGAEWQSIPRALRQDIEGTSANYTFRLVEPVFQLPLALERHDAARLLPARVNSVNLSSVISDEGVMLTQARVELVPGDKRLLHLKLPKEASFWFAFVNQNGVWPWREQDQILLPLEQQSKPNQAVTVEFFYSTRVGGPAHRKLDVMLDGPQFDLPLENITWRVYLNDKWHVAKTSGTLQLQEEQRVNSPVATDVQAYLSNETLLNREKTKVAEQMLAAGNRLLQSGEQRQARRAFQDAYGLSQHDDAFNEDARVQLHNLKLQQALVGLNVRQGLGGGDAMAKPEVQQLLGRKDANYTQQEAKQILDSNTADDNAALMKLAERLVQQQDAAIPAPTAIRAAIPEQGRVLTFRRQVQVNTWADMNIRLKAGSQETSAIGRLAALCGIFAAFAGLMFVARFLRKPAAAV